MSARSVEGRAFIDGSPVASIVLVETYNERLVRIPIPGENRDAIVDRGVHGQAHIAFSDVEDELRQRLQVLANSVMAPIEERRRLRDEGRNAVAVDLVLDDGRQFLKASVGPPPSAYLQVEEAAFTISLPG